MLFVVAPLASEPWSEPINFGPQMPSQVTKVGRIAVPLFGPFLSDSVGTKTHYKTKLCLLADGQKVKVCQNIYKLATG